MEHNKLWYDNLNKVCQDYSQRFGLSIETIAGIIVTLSAQKKWELNILQAEEFLKLGQVKGFHSYSQINQCKLIEQGIDPLKVWGRTAFKYRNFYKSILLQDGAVCIDTHMINLYLAKHPASHLHRVNDTNKIFKSHRLYSIIARWVIKEAKKHNLPTYQMQAQLWVEYRNNKLNKLYGKQETT